MPWDIKKIDGKFCVIKEGDGSKAGCHKTRGEAVDQLRALYSSEAEAAAQDMYAEGDIQDAVFHLTQALQDTPANSPLYTHLVEALAALGEYADSGEADPVVFEHTFEFADDMVEYAWEGPIVFENVTTGDNRVFRSDSINWQAETLPWAFRWQKHSGQGHAGSVPVGRVDRIERRDDGSIYGFGVVIPGLSTEAGEYLNLLKTGVGGGVSVDGDSAQFEIQEQEGGQPRVEFSSMRLRALSAVDIPAFNGARIKLVGSEPSEVDIIEAEIDDIEELAKKKKKKKTIGNRAYSWNVDDALVAAAIPILPSTEAFVEPNFEGPTALTVTKDGRVFGHLALFNTCHIGFPGTCVKPPKGSAYQYFHTGQIETAEGDFVDVGHLTFGTGHADIKGTPRGAAEHYDNTGTVAADVRAGEDQFGIWVVGALRPNLSDEAIREFRAAPLSGDWRKIAGKLELVGALAVNVPGFPVPRVRALVASGETEALFTFLESDDDIFYSDYELGLRTNKKVELAGKLDKLFQENEESEDDLPTDSEDLEEIPELPSITKKEIRSRGENLTPDQLKEDLKNLRELLDDDEEDISDTNREKLETLYNFFIKNGLEGEKRTEASTMELTLFANGFDPEELVASGIDITEFYNRCNDPETGRFCEGEDGPGRIRDKEKVSGRTFTPPSGGKPSTPSGPAPSGGSLSGAKQELEKKKSFAIKAAGEKYNLYKRSLKTASRWASAGSIAFAAAKLGGVSFLIGPAFGNPAALFVFAGVAALTAIKNVSKANGYRRDTNAKISEASKYDPLIRQQEGIERRANEARL